MKEHQSGSCAFEMIVHDVFSFANGRTVFVGEVTGPAYIRDCESDLIIAGTHRSRLKLEGEMTDPNPETGWRSLSTVEHVNVELVRSHRGDCRLRGVGDSQPAKGALG
jgi:hypothetical protein